MLHPSEADLAYMRAHADDNRAPLFVAVNGVCVGLVYFALIMRFISRMKIKTKIGLDDWLIALAALLVTSHVICLIVACHYGMGRHAIFVTNVRTFSIIMLVAQTFYNLCIATVKLSILCLYARIFQRTLGWFTPTLYVTALFVFLYTVPQCFVYIFQCVPISSLWTEYGPGYRVVCINFKTAIIAFGIINIITDWFILALPIPVVLGLRLDTRKKWSICSLFLIGFAVCVMSIVRLFYAKRVETVDPSWDYISISVVSTIECTTGILAACMPTWRPLFKSLRGKITSYVRSSSGHSRSDPERSDNTDSSDNTKRHSHHWAHSLSKSKRSRASQKENGDARNDQHGERPGMLGGIRESLSRVTSTSTSKTTKRSETSMSSSSVQNMLHANRDFPEDQSLEMTDQDPSDKGSPELSLRSAITPRLPPANIPLPAGTGMQGSWTSLSTIHLSHDRGKVNDKEKHRPLISRMHRRKPSEPDPWDASMEATAEPGVKWEAKAQSDRWDALMKQQTIRNERDASPIARGLKQKQKQKMRSNRGLDFGDIVYGGRIVRPEFEEEETVSRRQSVDQGRGGLGEGIVVTKTVERT
ncbi:hypothetical protein K491DRAFT_276662 [Lophiostoma macrostomum CBS 122681]|uniref:Rhodopsin domain-containing protein n=1 Tax=Lophiostoma macrostomum CBS 122681 TaxID=1314788 RepID=A0A6A6TEP2_9PLEO|nr:hypothetical protein K491DRAFT_276662 [Lophiostoma macrostomum CBS 122681]